MSLINTTESADTGVRDDPVSKRRIAERLFESLRRIAPFRRHNPFGSILRPGEFHLIHRLSHEREGLRVGDLAEWLGVRPPTASQLIDTLVAKGLVERYADEKDRRAIRVRLLPQGWAQAKLCQETAIKEAEAMVDYLGLGESERLIKLLGRVSSFMSQRRGGSDNEPCAFDPRTKGADTSC